MRRDTAHLRGRATGNLVMLLAQFVLGMITNLYVVLPSNHPGAGAGPYLTGALQSMLWTFTTGIGVLIAHVVLGILLVISAIELLVRAVRARLAAASWLGALGLAGILLAAFNGASFLKYHLSISSMLMSAGFTLAALCYVYILSRAT